MMLTFDSLAKELIHEAKMHKLRHPNIVTLIAVVFEHRHYGVLFEYVKYGGLDSFLQNYEVMTVMLLLYDHMMTVNVSECYKYYAVL